MSQQARSQLEKQQNLWRQHLLKPFHLPRYLPRYLPSSEVTSGYSCPSFLSGSSGPLNTVDSPSVSSWLRERLSMVPSSSSTLHHCMMISWWTCKCLHSRSPCHFWYYNNIINSVFYWYWHSKLTIIHEKFPAISIWHIQKNGGLFSAQTSSRGHLCLTSPKRGRHIKI